MTGRVGGHLVGRIGVVGLGLAIAACGTHPQIHAPVAEHLLGIRIEGNRAIASDALEPALALHEVVVAGAAADPYLVAADAERIRAAYIRRGFFAVKVTGDVLPGERGQVAVFTVVEGRRAATRVEIAGLPPELSPSAARAQVQLADGAPFDYDTYDAAKQPLTTLVQDAGYARARIEGQVTADPDGAVAIARYQVVPGPLCRFGKIDVRVPHPDLEAAVRARLRFATGDRYSASALAASQADIHQLGRFASVQLVPARDDDRPIIDVEVQLAEISHHHVYVGGGFAYDAPATLSVRGRGGGSWIPGSAPLWTAAADASITETVEHPAEQGNSPRKLRVLGSLQRLDLLWPRLRGEIEVGVDYQTVEAYTWYGPHARVGLASSLGPRWLQLRAGWRIERLDFRDLDSRLKSDARCDAASTEPACLARKALQLVGPQQLGAYEASLVADLRDNPIEPRRGGYFTVSAVRGARYAGGDLDDWQITPELRGYVSLGDLVVAAHARAGEIIGDVPVTARYYAGGVSSQRGFSERQLAPRVDPADPVGGCSDTGHDPRYMGNQALPVVIGGAGLIETGIELRRQIATLWGVPLGANLFLEGAQVTCKAALLDSLPSLHWATGTGVWVKLVGLKIHGDVGYRLNHDGPNDLPATGSSAFSLHGDLAWHIGIGEVF